MCIHFTNVNWTKYLMDLIYEEDPLYLPGPVTYVLIEASQP